jgi:ATP-binding cassette subfamily B protein
MSLFDLKRRAAPFRQVFAFTFRQWRRHKTVAAFITITVMLSTLADVFVPVFAGQLIDALASSAGASATDGARAAALEKALWALGSMIALGGLMLVSRHLAFLGIVRLTLRIMSDVAQEAFWRVQACGRSIS